MIMWGVLDSVNFRIKRLNCNVVRTSIKAQNSGGSRIFPRGVRQLPKVLLFFKYLTKTAWKWKNLAPLDPPMQNSANQTHSQVTFPVLSRFPFSFRNRRLFDLLQETFRIGPENREHGWGNSVNIRTVSQWCKGRIDKVKVYNVLWW